MSTRIISLSVTLLLLAGTLPASESAPTGAEVLDRFVEATGGPEAHARLHNRVTEAVFEAPSSGLRMDVTIYHARPALNYTRIESKEMGIIEKGTDGRVVWELSSTTGPQITTGVERLDFLRDTVFDRFVRWRELYESVEHAGVDEVQGRVCHKVEATPAQGSSQTWWFDRETGLLVKTRVVVDNALGTIPVVTHFDHYKRVDGILLSHLALVDVAGQRRTMTTTSVRHNVELPASRFDLPEEVSALVEPTPAEAAPAP